MEEVSPVEMAKRRNEMFARQRAADVRFALYSTMFFIFVLIFIGVPLWWQTTRVYRVALPTSEITDLNSIVVKLPVNVNLVHVDAGDKTLTAKIGDVLAKNLSEFVVHERLTLKFSFRVNSMDENLAQEFRSDSIDVVKLDDKMFAFDGTLDKHFALNFVILREVLVDRKKVKAYFGANSNVYVARENVESTIARCLLDFYVNVENLKRIAEKNLKDLAKERKSGNRQIDTDVQPTQAFEVSLVVPDPANCRPNVDKMEKVFEKDFQSFVDALEPLTKIEFSSQVLYYTDFDVRPTKDVERNEFYYNRAQLPHLINSLETYMGGLDADRPTYRIVIYLTPPKTWPLFVRGSPGGERSLGNSFIVSSWGGVFFVNTPNSCNNGSFTDEALSTDVQNAILSQCRHLLGLSSKQWTTQTEDLAKTKNALVAWEIQSGLYAATTDYLLNSIATLNSLTKLLNEITNIVINDDVGAAVEMAVASAQETMRSLNAVDDFDLQSACKLAKSARVDAERAFFDESLLALLYFPDDQKYAIYIPLCLPFCFPVVLSLRVVYKYMWKKDVVKAKSE